MEGVTMAVWNGGHATGWYASSPSFDSIGLRLGMAWVKETLQELTAGRHALIWWWETTDDPPSCALYLLGGARSEARCAQFAVSLLRECPRTRERRSD